MTDYSDPFSTTNLLNHLDSGKYGSATKEIMELLRRREQLMNSIYSVNPELSLACPDLQNRVASKTTELATLDVIDIDDDQDERGSELKRPVPAELQSHNAEPVVIIDSDDDNDVKCENSRPPHLEVNLKKPLGSLSMKDFLVLNF